MTFKHGDRHEMDYTPNETPSQPPLHELIIKVWQQQPGDYFFLASKRGGKFTSYPIARKDIEQRVGELIEEHGDKNLYWCCHGFSAKRRIKDNAVLPTMLYADLDGADPRTIKPRPTIALESSPGRFVGYWKTDKPITEDLNRRLTNHVGADKAGYDLTQVLRVPGTTNYKYPDEPEVKVLWTNGPTYKIADIEKELSKSRKDAAKPKVGLDGKEVWKRYRPLAFKKSLWLINLIEGDKPEDRSKTQGKAYLVMQTLGMSLEEIKAVWRWVPWAKGGDADNRRSDWLGNDIQNVIGKNKRRAVDDGDGDADEDVLWSAERQLSDGFFNMSDVAEEEYEWILHPFFARGELTIVQGDPKSGKSYFLQMVCLNITNGNGFEGLTTTGGEVGAGKVIYFDPENSVSKITAKRLRWNGFNKNKNKNFFVQAYSGSIGSPEFRKYVYRLMEEHKPAMVVFDTLLHFSIGDANDNGDMTKVTAWFANIARHYNCSIAVIRHMKKTGGRDAMTSGSGATAIGGVTRLVATVGRHTADKSIRVVTATKGTMVREDLPVPAFKIVSIEDEEPNQSQLVWEDELVDMSSDDMVAQNMAPSRPDKINLKRPQYREYMDVLKDMFAGGTAMSQDKTLELLARAGFDRVIGQGPERKDPGKKTREKAYRLLGLKADWAIDNADKKRKHMVMIIDQAKFDAYQKGTP